MKAVEDLAKEQGVWRGAPKTDVEVSDLLNAVWDKLADKIYGSEGKRGRIAQISWRTIANRLR